jgi:hypothetical protein
MMRVHCDCQPSRPPASPSLFFSPLLSHVVAPPLRQRSSARTWMKAVGSQWQRPLGVVCACGAHLQVPFYVIGMVSYEQLKLAFLRLKGKGDDHAATLAAWETIMVGALSGGIAAILTTPADVLKTRTMTGAVPAGVSVRAWLLVHVASGADAGNGRWSLQGRATHMADGFHS